MAGRWWVATVRPRRDAHQREVWALPKGLIDRGERGPETAVREAYEETGVRARLDRKLGDVRYVYSRPGGVRVFKVVSFFLLRATGGRIGELPPGMDVEISEARWLPLADAPRVLAYRGEREMAERALTILSTDAL
jgi:8-oxo-dGTP pyrophosphatase MutT (NUDIX family)